MSADLDTMEPASGTGSKVDVLTDVLRVAQVHIQYAAVRLAAELSLHAILTFRITQRVRWRATFAA